MQKNAYRGLFVVIGMTLLLPLIIPSIVYAIGLYRYFGPLGLLAQLPDGCLDGHRSRQKRGP